MQQVVQLHREKAQFESLGAKLVVVGNGKPWFIQGFRDKANYEGAVYTDPTLASYRALRLRRGLRSSMGLRSLQSALTAFRQGHRQTKIRGDAWQQGGVFVIDAKGSIRFSYPSEFAGDHPPMGELAHALRAIANEQDEGVEGASAPKTP